jgi:NADH-quinone oxidoreductase subunit N
MHSFLLPILNFIHGDGITVLPQMELLLLALGILIFDFLLEKNEKHWNAGLALVGVSASAFGLIMQAKRFNLEHQARPDLPGLPGFQNTVVIDGYSVFFSAIFLAATGLVILLSVRYLDLEREQEGEYYALILLACIGMMFMASGTDLIVMFLGLDTMALSFYVLAGYLRREKHSNEAALKYLLLGGFSTAILGYGFSLLYGLTGSTSIWEIGNILDRRSEFVAGLGMADWLLVLSFVTIAAGLFFKVAAVPFHQWAPDVYEGAPTPIAAYISVASKTASFALLVRLFFGVFGRSEPMWQGLVAGVAIASLTWGNLAALTQTNIKRLLAYSSISHVGYILLGLVAANETGLTGMVYYLIAYGFMNIGTFAIVVVLRQRGIIGDELDDLDGLYQRNPAAAVLLLIFMLSLAGVPPTAGFMGKYFVFLALIESHHPALAVFAALCMVPGLYYYFRVVVHAWLKKPGDVPAPVMSNAQAIALGAALFVTLAAGLYPEPFTRLAHYALGIQR